MRNDPWVTIRVVVATNAPFDAGVLLHTRQAAYTTYAIALAIPPLTVAGCAPETAQLIAYQLPLTVTGSLKLMAMLLLIATAPAPDVGTVLCTVGAMSTATVKVNW